MTLWDPQRYQLGNYFQLEITERFLKSLHHPLKGTILDVGAGDGYLSHKLANRNKEAHFFAIDHSAPMVLHAKKYWKAKNLSFLQHNIECFERPDYFDGVISFWCLHWTSIELSFSNIFHALKKRGHFFAVFSSFSDNSIIQSWERLAKENRHLELAKPRLALFAEHKTFIFRVIQSLQSLNFTKLHLKLGTERVHFPTLEYFEHLLLTLPTITALPEIKRNLIIHDLKDAFASICAQKYGGELYYEARPIFLWALK